MKRISRILLASIVLCLAAAAGGLAGAWIMAMRYERQVADQWVGSVMINTFVATRLRGGKAQEALHLIDTNLPNNAEMISTLYAHHPMAPKALRQIQSYYQKNNLEVPMQVAQAMKSLDNKP